MNQITISIIIPVYNMEKYLQNCLDSVIGQTLKNVEIICINDGSTDNSEKILRDYELSGAISVISQENKGSAVARNKGIDIAKGEYIAFMDPDDYYAGDDVLECLYDCAKREHVAICGGGVLYEYEGNITKSKVKYEIFDTNGIINYKDYQHICEYTAFIFQRKLLINNAIYFPNYRRFQDIPFSVNAMIHAGNFYAISKPVYVYRMVDKLIPFGDEKIINGIANGIDDVLLMSKEAYLEILHADIVQKLLDSYIDWFYNTIYAGNIRMKSLIQKIWEDIDEDLLVQDGRMKSKPRLKNEIEIKEYINKKRENRNKLLELIEHFQFVIIYGAGMMGRRVYTFLKQNNCKCVVEFAVSASNPNGTACGKRIRSIDAYTQYKDDAIVLIANRGDDCYMMSDTAKKMGYKNVEIVNYKDIMLF